MEKIGVKIKLLHPDAKIPVHATDGSAGFDIYSIQEDTILPGETKMIPTGLSFEVPLNYHLQVWDRSGKAKLGVHAFAGILDSDYRGELKILLHNASKIEHKIDKGSRMAQGIIIPVMQADFLQVEELNQTQRGEGGFHSTGTGTLRFAPNVQKTGQPQNQIPKELQKEQHSNSNEQTKESPMETPRSYPEQTKQEVIIIAGVAQNNVIGMKNKLPWHVQKDLQHFKELTVGNPVIMGRATCLSILSYLAKPLPDRTNIVLTDNPADKRDGFIFCQSIPQALEEAKKYGNKVYIMGGASVYKQFLPLATKLEMTHIHKDFEGDCFFPDINPAEWRATNREDHVGENFEFSFVSYERV